MDELHAVSQLVCVTNEYSCPQDTKDQRTGGSTGLLFYLRPSLWLSQLCQAYMLKGMAVAI